MKEKTQRKDPTS